MTNAQQARTARRKKTLWLVETALLAAVVILMSFTPLGYLKTAGVEITFIMIPVVIARSHSVRLPELFSADSGA